MNNDNSNSNQSWQNNEDFALYRNEMIQQITKILKDDNNKFPEWLKKQPKMSKQLEMTLYHEAKTLQAYKNISTLKQRLEEQINVATASVSHCEPDNEQQQETSQIDKGSSNDKDLNE